MIHIPNSGFPAGTIIVAAGLQPRYYEFQMALEGLQVPAGTKLHIERSCDVAQNFNKGIKAMTGDWAWFMGDDHSFDSLALMRLLGHLVPVVVPIAPCKVAPWMPCLMHGPANPEADGFWHEDMLLYDWDELSGAGLMALSRGDFIGQAGMLVRKPVLDRIGYPWFKAGQLDKGRLQEDMMFCHELQEMGYTVWVDQDMVLDHYVHMGVTARRHQGRWVPALKSGKQVVVLPEAKPAFMPNMPIPPPGKSPVCWTRLPDESAYAGSVENAPS